MGVGCVRHGMAWRGARRWALGCGESLAPFQHKTYPNRLRRCPCVPAPIAGAAVAERSGLQCPQPWCRPLAAAPAAASVARRSSIWNEDVEDAAFCDDHGGVVCVADWMGFA